jgi:hypothetical protein
MFIEKFKMKFNYFKAVIRMLTIIFGSFFVWVVASNDSNLLITSVTFILFLITALIDTSNLLEKKK